MMENSILLFLCGIFSGLLAGLMGVGGGTILVPMLVFLNYQAVQAVATSSLAIVMTSLSGSLQNWFMGYLDIKRVLLLGIPSLLTAQIGVYLADKSPENILLLSFGIFLLINIFLGSFRRQISQQTDVNTNPILNPTLARCLTGGSAGLLAGLLGIGGGLILVPLQILLLKEPIKKAIQTSLGVIFITALAACTGHALKGNVLGLEGLILGLGGLIGAQISTRFLPKLSDQTVIFCFNTLLILLAFSTFWQAWKISQ